MWKRGRADLFVVDEIEEGMVSPELCVEEGAGGPEAEDGGGGGRLAPLLVHLDEGPVDGAVQSHLVSLPGRKTDKLEN